MFRVSLPTVFIVFAVILSGLSYAVGEEFAQPPVWSEDVKDVFFDDARKAHSGEPPTDVEETASTTHALNEATGDTSWPEFIDDETLSTEVKRIANNLAALIKNPAQFKASKYQDCRRELTMLAALFGVIRDYPGDVRWKSSAAVMEQYSLHAAELCTIGSAESLAAAQETHALLAELLRGQTVQSEVNRSTDFPAFAPLMQRMEITMQENLPEALKNERNFRKLAVDVSHEAQLLAMLSQVIRREEYGYGDDEGYLKHADGLRETAIQLNEAASTQDFTKAVKAAAEVSQSCARCHAYYRG